MGENAADSFDYVIVGAGAAGSVLANRLTETPGVTVCVLEAGPPDRNPWIHIPAGFTKTLFDPGFTWQFKTEPTEQTAGRAIATTQGRTLGGSSSVNAASRPTSTVGRSAATAAGATRTCCRSTGAASGGSGSAASGAAATAASR